VAEGSVPANIPGVYPVTLRVTDSDGNETTQRIAVVVDDGSFVYSDNYILTAKSFTIDKSAVNNANKTGQIATQSGARAYRTDGTEVTVTVSELGGYQDVKGVYTPRIEVNFDPALNKTITATVTAPAVRYRVGFEANGGYLTGPSGIYVEEPNTTLSYLPSSPLRSGYNFLYWSTSPSGGAAFTTSTEVTSNMSVYAQWEQIPPNEPPIINVYPPNVNVYPPNVNVTTPPANVTVNVPPSPASPTYINIEVPEQQKTPTVDIPDTTTPKDPGTSINTWSLFNVCATILALLLTLFFLIRYFIDRKKPEEYEEETIDWNEVATMSPERQAALMARREEQKQAFYEEQEAKQNKEKAFYVNAAVLLIVAAAFVESLIILLTTSNFYAKMVVTDVYSIPLSLIVLLQLITPMVAAMLKKRNQSNIQDNDKNRRSKATA